MQIFVANNNEIIRFGLCKIAESLDVCSLIESGPSSDLYRDEIDWTRFDCIILNRLRGRDNVADFIAKLKLLDTDIKVLVLADQPSFAEIQLLFSLGIKGYVDSAAPMQVIREATRVVLSGLLYVEPSMLLNYFEAGSWPNDSAEALSERKLSEKESEIAMFLVAGLRTAKISKILNKRASTISAHKRNIFSKLRVNSVIELMRYMDIKSMLKQGEY